MTATLARMEHGGSWHPGLRNGAEPAHEARAIVHVVGFDEELRKRIADLFASVGVDTRAHASVGAFSLAELPDAPGCVMAQARTALIGALDFLKLLPRPGTGLPMIVAADRADVRTAVLAMKAGAIDFLEKPLCDQEVLEAVGTALRIDQARRKAEAHRAAIRARYARLTQRERQVMVLVTQGRLNKQVAGDLGISEVTVKVHRGSAMRKMGARTLADLVRMADMVAVGSEAGA